MDTFPEPFTLSNPSAGTPTARRGFRVPFGLREGRVWAPGEVAKGLGCGCVCPACHAPLIAKAQTSRRRRPHFAHLTDTHCETGRETGIHLRAKQLIVERAELLTPAWNGDRLDMPNPAQARDDEGRIHVGSRVDFPAMQRRLADVEAERQIGGFRPDLVAQDDDGELLIEIRVTHAVDD
ncbi:competence protein CoiA family protein, partial [Arenimonas composti]